MSKPALKQFNDLSPSDFLAHEVWVGCHIVDHHEPWYDGTDEETFRPWDGPLPVDPVDAMFLVRAEATLRDGTRLQAFLTPAETPGDLGVLQPHVFVNDRPFGFWGGLPGFAEERRRQFLDLVAKTHAEVFPLQFETRPGLARGAIHAIVTDWPPGQ